MRFELEQPVSIKPGSNYSKIIPHHKMNYPNLKRRFNRKYKIAYEGRNVRTIKQLAKQNHSQSLHTLGELYELYEKNLSTAFELFQKSADLGDSEAFSSLSFYLRYGFEYYNLPQDRLLSAIYTTIGSEGNSIRSMLTLANDYKHSFIRPKSYRSCIEILLKLDTSLCNCIELGECDQTLPTKIKLTTMKTFSLNSIFDKKFQVLKYRAKLGDRQAMFETAKSYYNSGEVKNITEAYKLFSKIADYKDDQFKFDEPEVNSSELLIIERIQNNIFYIKQNFFFFFGKLSGFFRRIWHQFDKEAVNKPIPSPKINDKKLVITGKSNINDPLVSKSLSYIGRMYHLGQLFEKNISKAKELYLKSHNEINSIAGLGLIELEDGNDEEAEILLSIASRMGHLGASFNLASLHFSKNRTQGISELFSLAERPDSNFVLARLNVASMLSQGVSSNSSMFDEELSMKYLWKIAQGGLWNNASDIAAQFFAEKDRTTDKKKRIFLAEKALLIWIQLADMGMKVPAFNAGLILYNHKSVIRKYDFLNANENSELYSDFNKVRKSLRNLSGILNSSAFSQNDTEVKENFFGWSERKMLKVAVRMFKISEKPQMVSMTYLKMNETEKCLKYLKKIKENKAHYRNRIFIKLMLDERINYSFKLLFGNLTQLGNRRKGKLNTSYGILTLQIWGKFVYKLLHFNKIKSDAERKDLVEILMKFRIDLVNVILLLVLLKLVRIRVLYFFPK